MTYLLKFKNKKGHLSNALPLFFGGGGLNQLVLAAN